MSAFSFYTLAVGGSPMDRKKDIIKDWIYTILQAGGILLLFFIFAWPACVDGRSMEPTFNDGDRVLISRFLIWTGNYDKGDIITFDYGEKSLNLAKRIIAMEGDRLEIKDGFVYVNDEKLAEDFGYTDGNIDIEIPEDCVFVMGDNRKDSKDSRSFGVVNKEDIYGRIIARFYPLDKITIFN